MTDERSRVRACSRRCTVRETIMSLTTRAMGALAVLSLAAIPVTALSIQSASWDDTSATGESRVAAGASSDEDRDCNPDCAVAEAPHASRLLSQAITPDTEMGS